MPKYKSAEFEGIVREESLYEERDLVDWSDVLDRSFLYMFDKRIGDIDYLLTVPQIRSLRSITCIEYIIEHKYHQRPDQLAADRYGDVDYWWIILMVNGLEDFDDFEQDKSIKLPEQNELDIWLSDLHFELARKNRRKV